MSTWKKIEVKYGELDVAKKGRPLEEQYKDYKERYEILKKIPGLLNQTRTKEE